MKKDQTMPDNLEKLVSLAVGGSSHALEELVRRMQGRVYGLCLRMLYHPMDAEDACQEILVKVITNLKSFRAEGSFEAWVYRIAANHLKGVRMRRSEGRGVDMDKAQARLDQAQAKGWFSAPLEAPAPLLEMEMRSACTQALLMALDRDHRLAFILGAIMGLTGAEAADILDITPAAFRKRLSRARERLFGFLSRNCELFGQSNRCTCAGLAAGYTQKGWINPDRPMYVCQPGEAPDNTTLRDCMRELDDLGKVSAMFKALPAEQCRVDFAVRVKKMLDQGQYRVLAETSIH